MYAYKYKQHFRVENWIVALNIHAFYLDLVFVHKFAVTSSKLVSELKGIDT